MNIVLPKFQFTRGPLDPSPLVVISQSQRASLGLAHKWFVQYHYQVLVLCGEAMDNMSITVGGFQILVLPSKGGWLCNIYMQLLSLIPAEARWSPEDNSNLLQMQPSGRLIASPEVSARADQNGLRYMVGVQPLVWQIQSFLFLFEKRKLETVCNHVEGTMPLISSFASELCLRSFPQASCSCRDVDIPENITLIHSISDFVLIQLNKRSIGRMVGV